MKRPYTRRDYMSFFLTALFAYVVVVAVLFVNQRSFIYFPNNARYVPAQAGAPEMQVIAVRPSDMDESIEGWYKAPASPDKPVLLYFHGNGGGVELRVPRVRELMADGYGVLLAEYRGYNGNPGHPTEDGLFADARAYYTFLTGQEGISPGRIMLYGESLGTGVATYLASENDNVRGMVLEAPYTSLVDVARRTMFFIPLRLLMHDQYHSIRRIAGVRVPVLVLHGQRDTIVPSRLGEKLFLAANEPKEIRLFSDGGHVDLYEHGAGGLVRAFMDDPELFIHQGRNQE